MAHLPGFTPQLLDSIDRIERVADVQVKLVPIFRAILDSPYDYLHLKISQDTYDAIIDQVYPEWDGVGFGTAIIVVDDSIEFGKWALEAQVNA